MREVDWKQSIQDAGWRRAWISSVAGLVDPSDRSSFSTQLLTSLRQVTRFSHSITFAYPAGRRPILLHYSFARPELAESVGAYIRGTFLVDPFYEACQKSISEGVHRMEDLAPDDFYNSIGSHPGYISPCVSSEPGAVSEEIGFFARTGQDEYVVLSLMRDRVESPFSEVEMDCFREIAPFICAAMRLQYRQKLAAQRGGSSDLERLNGPGDLHRVMSACIGEHATPREIEVAAMMLRGHSSGSIAAELNISVSTVKNHRRNLYEKLEVSSQAAFFSIILSYILK